MPVIFFFSMTQNGEMVFRQCFPTQGNVLDIAILDTTSKEEPRLVYGMDCVHRPFSTDVVQEDNDRLAIGNLVYQKGTNSWIELDLATEEMNQCLKQDEHDGKGMIERGSKGSKPGALSDLLYGIENMRKRGPQE